MLSRLTVYFDGDLAFIVSSVFFDLGATDVLSVVLPRHVLDAQSFRRILITTAGRCTYTVQILCTLIFIFYQ